MKLDSEWQSGMIKTLTSDSPNFLEKVFSLLESDGVFVLAGVLSRESCDQLITGAEIAYQAIKQEIGESRLERSGELGVARFPLKHCDDFAMLLNRAPILQIVETLIGKSAICHSMNAILLPTTKELPPLGSKSLFQSRFHQDFPRYTGGRLLSLNSFFCLTDFTVANGATQYLIGSHKSPLRLDSINLSDAVSANAVAGSVMIFDPTIWHAGGTNLTSSKRVGVNVQWTHHWIKQQIDLVRLLGVDRCSKYPEDIRQRLGFNSRTVTSLAEYYVSPEERIYKAGQG